MNTCPACGKELGAEAIQGACPACLMKVGLGSGPGAEPVAAQPLLTPADLAEYFPQLEILECLGRGGMGVVYKARQPRLNRLVALKILAPERAQDPAFAGRFEKEAQALAQLSHPNIVTLHEFGQADGLFYFIMEFVDGVNLRQAMKAGRFTPEQALAVVPPVCEALQYAHNHGIVHRDIKPENLLLDKEGRVKIADFGLAKMLGAGASGVGLAESQPAGTPQYMAPEQQHTPQLVDSRADIYSLGVVLYEMLTGELPTDKLQPPSRKVQIDVRLDEIVLRALEVKPESRYQTAGEFRTQVETVASTSVSKKPAAANSGTSSPQVLKSSRSTIATPEHMATWWGKYVNLFSGKGRITLEEHQLTYSDYEAVTEIPLNSIRDLSIGRYSLWAKPTGLNFIRVTFEDGGQLRSLCFMPHESGLHLTSDANLIVAEWFDAIRGAIITLTGRAPTTGPAERGGKPLSVRSVSRLIYVAPLLCFLVLLATLGANHRWLSFAAFAVVGILCVILLPMWLRRDLRRWSTAPAGSAASRGPGSPWWTLALILAVYGGFGLEYTKHIVRQGAGFWVPEAMSAALSHRPESTVPLIVGTVWLWILCLRMPLPTSRPAYLKRLLGLKIVPALAIVVLLRTYLVQPFSVPTDSAAPEIPRGSHILVWKFYDNFARGDMIAYCHTGKTFVGRVVSATDTTVTVSRNGQPDAPVQRPCIEGKVISVYWRAVNKSSASQVLVDETLEQPKRLK
jgi:serine/threonine protein kinase